MDILQRYFDDFCGLACAIYDREMNASGSLNLFCVINYRYNFGVPRFHFGIKSSKDGEALCPCTFALSYPDAKRMARRLGMPFPDEESVMSCTAEFQPYQIPTSFYAE